MYKSSEFLNQYKFLWSRPNVLRSIGRHLLRIHLEMVKIDVSLVKSTQIAPRTLNSKLILGGIFDYNYHLNTYILLRHSGLMRAVNMACFALSSMAARGPPWNDFWWNSFVHVDLGFDPHALPHVWSLSGVGFELFHNVSTVQLISRHIIEMLTHYLSW